MSGIIGSKLNIRGSGGIAKLGTDGQVLTSSGAGVAAAFEDAAGGGLDWQSVTTGTTLTAVAGNGYPIDTTSNICTITLPASASVGDQIIFTDYDRTWGTYYITLDSNGLNYQGEDDTNEVIYNTDGQSLHIVYMDATNGWIPISDEAVTDAPTPPFTGNQEGIFVAGKITSGGTTVGMSNLVSSSGVLASDVAAVATARRGMPGCEYGDDKGIFAFGKTGSPNVEVNTKNLVSNTGVVASDASGVGTARAFSAACSYNYDKGIFSSSTTPSVDFTNLVSNAGVVATDVAGVGTLRTSSGFACEFNNREEGMFAFGGAYVNYVNLVSDAGVVSSDVAAVNSVTARADGAGLTFGATKGFLACGYDGSYVSITNIVSNTGVVQDDAASAATARGALGGTQYGGDKGILGFGNSGSGVDITNLVSNTGVVASDASGVGTARYALNAVSFAT